MKLQPTIFALVLAGSLAALAAPTRAAEEVTPPREPWSFAGPFGKYDPAQLQRGFKIYREVCSTCHSMNLVSFRNLAEPGGPGFTEAQVKQIASEYKIKDLDDKGNPIERAGRPADHFPPPFPNELAAKAGFGVAPPDMSTLAKARTYQRGFPWFVFDMFTQYQEEGPDYIAAILQGYKNPPKGFNLPPGGNYNEYFPGHNIAMPPPLLGRPGEIRRRHAGNTAAVFQGRRRLPDVGLRAAHDRAQALGFQVMIFLIVFAGLLYFTKKKVWHDVHHETHDTSKTA